MIVCDEITRNELYSTIEWRDRERKRKREKRRD